MPVKVKRTKTLSRWTSRYNTIENKCGSIAVLHKGSHQSIIASHVQILNAIFLNPNWAWFHYFSKKKSITYRSYSTTFSVSQVDKIFDIFRRSGCVRYQVSHGRVGVERLHCRLEVQQLHDVRVRHHEQPCRSHAVSEHRTPGCGVLHQLLL